MTDKQREYHRKYYAEHHEELLEYQRKYKAEHKEKILQQARERHAKNPEKQHEASRKWRMKNQEHLRKYRMIRYAENRVAYWTDRLEALKRGEEE